jgi:hypothetical protein
MVKAALNIFVIVGYIAIVCFIAYKIMIFLMDKIFALIKSSKWFRVLVFFLGSLMCGTAGVMQLKGYYSGEETEKTLFIAPVLLIASLFFLYCTFLAYKDKRQKIE